MTRGCTYLIFPIMISDLVLITNEKLVISQAGVIFFYNLVNEKQAEFNKKNIACFTRNLHHQGSSLPELSRCIQQSS